jgi:hypothetical protein
MLQRDLAPIAEANSMPMSLELSASLRKQNDLFLGYIPFALEIAWNTSAAEKRPAHTDCLDTGTKSWQG